MYVINHIVFLLYCVFVIIRRKRKKRKIKTKKKRTRKIRIKIKKTRIKKTRITKRRITNKMGKTKKIKVSLQLKHYQQFSLRSCI